MFAGSNIYSNLVDLKYVSIHLMMAYPSVPLELTRHGKPVRNELRLFRDRFMTRH
jgi:hypothetical protein